jgi:transcriptional regulator with XRE-family HTH domain
MIEEHKMGLFQNPGEDDYDALLAENAFIHDVQIAIEAAMDAHAMTQADLATLLNVSEARVSHILSANGRNLQARTIARIAHALGCRAAVSFVDARADWSVSFAEVDGELANRSSFAKWMSAACEIMDRGDLNDNGWDAPEAGQQADNLVAA